MLGSRLRDWRMRRKALREWGAQRRADENLLANMRWNLVQQAAEAARSGSIDEALALWANAQKQFSSAIHRMPEALELLLILRRFDEAEELMTEGLKQCPSALDNGGNENLKPFYYLKGLAEIAERRGDLEEAARRWKRLPYSGDDSGGLIRAGKCLMQLNRLNEAETLFLMANRQSPEEIYSWIRLAEVSDQRDNPTESAYRWKAVADRFRYGPAFANYARALVKLGRGAEADTYIAFVWQDFKDRATAEFQAWRAQKRDDLAAACNFWSEVRNYESGYAPGYKEGAECLFNAGRFGEADALLDEASRRFSDESWPLVDRVLMAQRRGLWNEARALRALLRERFPEVKVIDTDT